MSGRGKMALCNAWRSVLKPQVPEPVALNGEAIRAAFGDTWATAKKQRVTWLTRL